MNSVKILHCADIHIGAAESFLKSGAESRRFETLITFERIVDLAIKEKVSIVALCGDIFDSNSVENTFVSAFFNKIYQAADINFVFSAGNHDPLTKDSPFIKCPLPENLYVLDSEDSCLTFEDLKLRVYGRSFSTPFLKGEDTFELQVPNDDFINLMVQHGDLTTDKNSGYNAITPEFIENSNMDYIALGHIHKRSEIRKIANTFFAYCGCPEGQGFDELDEKGVYIGEIGKNYNSLKFVNVAKRQHIHEKIDISNSLSNAEISGAILSTLENKYGLNYGENLYKIELTGEIEPENELSTAEIESRISNLLYYVKIKDSTSYKLDLQALANEASLKGVFVKLMLQKIEEAKESEKETYKNALKLGLKAFISEVKYNED